MQAVSKILWKKNGHILNIEYAYNIQMVKGKSIVCQGLGSYIHVVFYYCW